MNNDDILLALENPYRDDPVIDELENVEIGNTIADLNIEDIDSEAVTAPPKDFLCVCESNCKEGPCCGFAECILNKDQVYSFMKRKDVLKGMMLLKHINAQAFEINIPRNANYRHTFYRIYHFLRIGQEWDWTRQLRYIKRKRIPIPGCVVQYIRREYPESDEKYVGFKAKRTKNAARVNTSSGKPSASGISGRGKTFASGISGRGKTSASGISGRGKTSASGISGRGKTSASGRRKPSAPEKEESPVPGTSRT